MIGPSRAFSRKPVGLLFVLGIVSICANCAWRAKAVTYYAFDYPAPQKEPGTPIPETLMVYRFLLARSVPMESLMISESKDGEKSNTAYNWEENPADMITELVLRDFQKSNLFDRSVDQLSPALYRYALEGTIRDLQGVVKDGKAMAVLHVDATLTDFEPPKGGQRTIMKKDYSIELPSADTKPESIIRALNSAVQQLSEQLRRDIRSSISKRGIPDAKKCALEFQRLVRNPTCSSSFGNPCIAGHVKQAAASGRKLTVLSLVEDVNACLQEVATSLVTRHSDESRNPVWTPGFTGVRITVWRDRIISKVLAPTHGLCALA